MKKSTKQLKDSKGKLTSYAFHCGYQETRKKGANNKRLYYHNGVYIVSCKINLEISNYFLNTLPHAMEQYNSIKL